MISGQNLPKPGDKSGEIVDPYVVLQITGVKEDRKEFKTKVVKDNGKKKIQDVESKKKIHDVEIETVA